MKLRLIALLLCLAMIFSLSLTLVSCGGGIPSDCTIVYPGTGTTTPGFGSSEDDGEGGSTGGGSSGGFGPAIP